MIKLISFDLQGTISDSNFSNSFWLYILPEKYSKYYNIDINESKSRLKDFFDKIGKYDFRYYDEKYWESVLNFNTKEELKNIKKPKLDLNILNLVKNIKIPCIIFSTTTHTFIDLELGKYQSLFKECISTLSNFNIAGKSPNAYKILAKKYNLKPSEILHIGDDFEMDIKNSKKAGLKSLLYTSDIYKKIKYYLQE